MSISLVIETGHFCNGTHWGYITKLDRPYIGPIQNSSVSLFTNFELSNHMSSSFSIMI